jgi:hypothetical protein
MHRKPDSSEAVPRTDGAAYRTLRDYYRLSDCFLSRINTVVESASGDVGFFQFGPGNICYGRCQSGVAPGMDSTSQCDASQAVGRAGSTLRLPFSFSEVIDNLRLEHYRQEVVPGRERFAATELSRQLYYLIRGFLPVRVRRQLQRIYFHDWRTIPFPAWPVDFTVDNLHEEFLRLVMEQSGSDRVPFIWFWPDGAPNCLMMTHDVETADGRDFTPQLMDLDESYGVRASYQVIPEKRYEVSEEYIREIRGRGFEFNIHDLNHDGHLYKERAEFERRAARINGYARKYNTRGFRAGAMYRNQDWYDAFEFSYDMSIPNVAHLEPKRGGCCTVMPFFIGNILELPLTLAQDYSLFHILEDYSIDLWKRQLALIRQRHGLMSFITHPDYLIERRARDVYASLLDYLRQMVKQEQIWGAKAGDVDEWWRSRSQMLLEPRGSGWRIVGPGAERARVAYAVLNGGRLSYELAEHSPTRSSSQVAGSLPELQ